MKIAQRVIFLLITCSSVIHANINEEQVNTVDYSIIRSVGAVCGAGLSGDAKLELDTKLTRLFGGITAAGTARLDLGQVEQLLNQFSENQSKEIVYKTYVTCVTQAITSILGTSKETNTVPVIDNLLIPDPLIVIKNRQRFAMKAGDSRAVTRDSLMLTINKVVERKGNTNRIYYTYSDMREGGKSAKNKYVNQASPITFYDGCSINPYEIDATKGEEKVSFIVLCE